MAVTMSYPKVRDVYVKFIPIARTDSATEKCWLPKEAILVGAFVTLSGNCAGTTATISVGYGGSVNEVINAFNVSTADAGFHSVAGKAGADLIANTKQTADRLIKATYAAGDSGETTGSLGTVRIEYIMPGGGETVIS